MTTPTIDDDLAALSAAPVKFEQMNEIQRRLHNAAIVLGSDGDEYGFERLQRDAIAEISRLIAALKEAQAELSREQPARVGLTDEQIVAALRACDTEDPTQDGWIWRQRIRWARAIERAHNIPAAQEGK